MSDTSPRNSTALAKRFSNTQFEIRVHKLGDIARSIVNDAEEPEKPITDIALAIIMEFEDLSMDNKTKGLKLNERVGLAMDNITSLYEHTGDADLKEWQMRHGLSRGEQAVYSANHIVFGRMTLEGEVDKVKRRIASRIQREQDRVAAIKARKNAKSTTRKRTPKAAKPAEESAS